MIEMFEPNSDEKVLPEKCLCIHCLDGYETYKIDDHTIGVRPKWISVKDRLPQENEWIYLANSIYELTTWGIFIDGCFVNPDLDYLKISGVSHWMPLPEPPNE